MTTTTQSMERLQFPGSQGAMLSARLDMPTGNVRAFALFAHCFTCSKDIMAAKRIAEELSSRNIAVLRFDFTGLGSSEGEFAHTDFSSNIGDLHRAIDYLREHYRAPSILIGHSLGGAAVLAAAGDVPEVKAVATIGAPADADHVIHNFHAHVDEITEKGAATVSLAGREFTIRREFIDDLQEQSVRDRIGKLGKALLVFHSPIDATVSITNAEAIYKAARHPKSFVTLDKADHLLSRAEDARYVAKVIAAWAEKYLDPVDPLTAPPRDVAVHAQETGGGRFQTAIRTGAHSLVADEPKSVGGLDSGPSPYDLLGAALASCTSMTIRMYADRKGFKLDRIAVDVDHDKVHADDCAGCDPQIVQSGGKIDVFRRRIHLEGDLSDDDRARILAIANKCPVHRTLEAGAHVTTALADG